MKLNQKKNKKIQIKIILKEIMIQKILMKEKKKIQSREIHLNLKTRKIMITLLMKIIL